MKKRVPRRGQGRTGRMCEQGSETAKSARNVRNSRLSEQRVLVFYGQFAPGGLASQSDGACDGMMDQAPVIE